MTTQASSVALSKSAKTGPTNIAGRREHLVEQEATPSAIWSPRLRLVGAVPTSDDVLARRALEVPVDIEHAIIATITRPLAPGETHAVGNDRKEQEIAGQLCRLTPAQALAVRRRLEIDAAGDELATAFKRLVVERRERLRAFLRSPRFR